MRNVPFFLLQIRTWFYAIYRKSIGWPNSKFRDMWKEGVVFNSISSYTRIDPGWRESWFRIFWRGFWSRECSRLAAHNTVLKANLSTITEWHRFNWKWFLWRSDCFQWQSVWIPKYYKVEGPDELALNDSRRIYDYLYSRQRTGFNKGHPICTMCIAHIGMELMPSRRFCG